MRQLVAGPDNIQSMRQGDRQCSMPGQADELYLRRTRKTLEGDAGRRRRTAIDPPDVPLLLLPAESAQGCFVLSENLAMPSVTEKGRLGMALGFAAVSPVRIWLLFILTVW